MRTLVEIRQKNKRKDLLLDGMENASFSLPQELKYYEDKIYNDFIKLHAQKMFLKHVMKLRDDSCSSLY